LGRLDEQLTVGHVDFAAVDRDVNALGAGADRKHVLPRRRPLAHGLVGHSTLPPPDAAAATGMRPCESAVMRASISSRKNRSRLRTGDMMLGPNAQIVVCANGALSPGTMLSPKSSIRSRSCGRPSPFAMRYRILSIQPEPSRQGVHLPHDSWAKNFTNR